MVAWQCVAIHKAILSFRLYCLSLSSDLNHLIHFPGIIDSLCSAIAFSFHWQFNWVIWEISCSNQWPTIRGQWFIYRTSDFCWKWVVHVFNFSPPLGKFILKSFEIFLMKSNYHFIWNCLKYVPIFVLFLSSFELRSVYFLFIWTRV